MQPRFDGGKLKPEDDPAINGVAHFHTVGGGQRRVCVMLRGKVPFCPQFWGGNIGFLSPLFDSPLEIC